jgi:acyl-CoA synthetase (AMP-forming)/AMP-acid ligase II
MKTLGELLYHRHKTTPDRVAYIFLGMGQDEMQVTYRDLFLRSLAVASQLRQHAPVGSRAVILHPPGFDYIIAFFGCMLAGIIAVPCYPPRFGRGKERLLSVIKAAKPEFLLAPLAYASELQELADGSGIRMFLTDIVNSVNDATFSSSVTGDSIAFLQFTSGSTGHPKGVQVTHANIMNNSRAIRDRFQNSEESVGVIWLPPYHDMGLIGGIFQPLFAGFPMVVMSPFSFIQKPIRWLEAISKYQATISGGPNFAFQLCNERIGEDKLTGLDLSSWNVAFCGAEPINPKVMRQFTEKFSRCGFESSAFLPCYGLAEATLIVTGTFGINVNRENRVSCGRVIDNHTIQIVDPVTRIKLTDGIEGEIWVQGPSVTKGYWNNPDSTNATFGAQLSESHDSGEYLRTGDLGYIQDGALVVTGRMKDLIIIRGSNYYPHDIEDAVCQSYASFSGDSAAAFSIEVDLHEHLVVVVEAARSARRNINLEDARKAAVEAITRQFAIPVRDVVIVSPGEVPKTTSGKVSRARCREIYISGRLQSLESSQIKGCTRGDTTKDHHSVKSDDDLLVSG